MSELVTQVSSTIDGLSREFDVIAHNIANVGTVGYKRRINTFSKVLSAQGAGTAPEDTGQPQIESLYDFSQGSIVESRQPLDFALCGKGFFVIETPDGPLYTRNGMFRLNQNGQIVDLSGRIVAGDAGPIAVPSDIGLHQITVASDGTISGPAAQIGKFRIVDFKDDEKSLIAVGNNCFQAPDEIRPAAADNVVVKQAFQETSNVQLVEELVDMMMVSRLYQANMQFISVNRDASKSLMGVAMG